jgi:transmembrane sensor
MAIRPDPSSTARFGRRAFLSGALAGAAAAVGYLVVRPPFGLWPSISEFSADYRTKTAEQKHLALADGVSVQMSAQTSITIHPTSDSNATHIELIAGEAMVTAGMTTKPFVLTAGNGRTIAQAASVDIRYVDSNVCVTCIDGEVRVEQGSAAASLQSGQQLIYSAQALSSVRTVDPVAVTAWREGILVFHETPLAEAIEEINRYRPGRIVVVNDALGARLFNARFRIENIDEVVDQVRQVFDARVTSLPGGIVLLG